MAGLACHLHRAAQGFSAELHARQPNARQPIVNAALVGAVGPVPARSLDGRVDSFNGRVRLNAAPLDGLRLDASDARDVRDSRTAVQTYPAVVTDTLVDLASHSNTPFGLWQDWLKFSADYRGPGSLRLSGGVDLDHRELSFIETVTTRETTGWARATLQPVQKLALSIKLAHANRDHSNDGTAVWFRAPENRLLRKFNLAAQARKSVSNTPPFPTS